MEPGRSCSISTGSKSCRGIQGWRWEFLRARWLPTRRFQCPATDVVEDAIVAKSRFVQYVGREYVAFANGDVARVVANALIGSKRVGLRKPADRAARHERESLIVAETAEESIGGGEGAVHTNIELRFVQLAHRFVDVVEPAIHVVGVRRGIKVNHRLADVVEQGGGIF